MTDASESIHILAAIPLIGPLLDDEDMARAIAELLLKRLHGGSELTRQQPLRVTDEGEYWLVMGSYQEPGSLPDSGAFMLRIRKSDCWVEKFGIYEPREVPEEIKSFFKQQKP